MREDELEGESLETDLETELEDVDNTVVYETDGELDSNKGSFTTASIVSDFVSIEEMTRTTPPPRAKSKRISQVKAPDLHRVIPKR